MLIHVKPKCIRRYKIGYFVIQEKSRINTETKISASFHVTNGMPLWTYHIATLWIRKKICCYCVWTIRRNRNNCKCCESKLKSREHTFGLHLKKKQQILSDLSRHIWNVLWTYRTAMPWMGGNNVSRSRNNFYRSFNLKEIINAQI